MNMKKGIALIFLTILCCCTSVKTEAAIITGETALGGFSYILDRFYENGGTNQDLFPNMHEVSKKDKKILYRIVEAEATGGTLEQKKNVASCILNRMDTGWGKTVEDVVFDKGQFSPISDGRYYTVEITASTIKAVEYVLIRGAVHDSIYFCTNTCKSAKSGFHSTLNFQFFDGMHNYYKEGGN